MSLLISGDLRCKNYGAPAAIAGVAPTLDYRFALDRRETEAVTLTDKLTFSRTATCAYTDAGGKLALAGANVPRFDHSLTTRQSLGLLVEAAGTNLALYSEQIDDAYWARLNATIAANAIVAPNGITTADLLTSSGSPGYVEKLFSLTAGTYTLSVFLKAGPSAGTVDVYFFNPGILAPSAFTLAGSGSASGSGRIESAGDGWYRCSITSTLSGTAGMRIILNNGKNCYIWGAQLEAGSSPTSYIPTTTAAVTRSESVTVSLAGLPATRTLVEKPAGCATVAGDTLTLNPGYTAERVMVFPAALSGDQITAIRGVM